YLRGEQGSIARVGDDVYAAHDGNVYKRADGGGWQERQSDGSWGSVQDPARTGNLDREHSARSTGENRVEGYDPRPASAHPGRRRGWGYGGGYRSGGGFRGGGRRR